MSRSPEENAAPRAERRFEFERVLMGVPFRIVAYGTDEDAVSSAARAAFARVRELNAIFSDYDPESEVRRLCADASSTPQTISPELLEVLLLSRELWERSSGAFDPSLAPVIELWRRSRRSGTLATDAERAAALARRGFGALEIDVASHSLRLPRQDLRLDFGGVAKGFAADEALRVLRARGCPRAFVDAGGDIALGQAPPGERGWKIALEHLMEPERSAGALVLSNISIATSGDTWQYVEIDGVRYAHIIDPATGLGLSERFSVTVLAPSCALADGLATTLCVLGVDRGLKLIATYQGVEASLANASDGSVELHRSPGFAAYVVYPDEGE